MDGLHHGRSVGYQDCRELRKACLNKEELRQRGQGNCQRYHRSCGLEFSSIPSFFAVGHLQP